MRRWALLFAMLATACVPPAAPAQVIWAGPSDAPAVAITFDGHNDAVNTPAILDLFRDVGVAATFFVTADWAVAHPDWLQRMAAEGHLVASHSASHPDLTKLSDAAIVDELAAAEAAISAVTGHSTKPWFRPPFGAHNARVDRVLAEQGYRYDVLWTVDSLGWKGLTPAQVVRRCVDRAEPGAILMLHLSSPADRDALPWVIQALRDQGYSFVRLDAWFA